jgi:hypothetical protein
LHSRVCRCHENELKIRTDIAMMGIKLNAQVIIKNLQNMHEKLLPPTVAQSPEDGAGVSGLSRPACKACTGRGPHTGGRNDRLVGWPADVVESRDGQ